MKAFHRFTGRRRWNLPLLFCGAIALLGGLALLAACTPAQSAALVPITISGTVADDKGPIAGAVVQVQGTPNQTKSAPDGSFTMHGEGLGVNKVVTMTAWAQGHFVGWVNLDPQKPIWQNGGSGVVIKLNPLYTTDNNQYTWFTFEGKSGSASCSICHREYKEWKKDAHGNSANNYHFIQMYTGTDMHGNTGQLTQLETNNTALPPDPSQPYYGPGFQLDYPSRAGNCATCHTPVASNTPTQQNCAWAGCHTSYTAQHAASTGLDIQGISPVGLLGAGTDGISCEFCHKIGQVILNPHTNLPYPDMPGILSTKLYRPSGNDQLFFGTVTDVARHVAYSSLETQSAFCAPCHYGVLGGVVGMNTVTGGTLIYNSYGEWLNSPWSDPKTGKTCQDCHMPKSSANYFVFPDKGGITRNYVTLHDHTMLGGTDQTLLWNAVTMKSSAAHNGNSLQVQVSITNDKTGHDMPTDAPMRSVMLVVEAQDASGRTVALQQGPTLPAWTGNYAGQPGKAFAKILKDQWTGETPTSSFWRPVTITQDTRLAPYKTDSSTYTFNLPAGSAATVKIKLIYRRYFQQLEQQKEWHDPDYTMAEATIPVEK